MKRIVLSFLMIIVLTWTTIPAAAKDVEVKGKQLISQKPPFTLALPSEFRPVHSFSQENPSENSLTRGYFLIKEKNKQVEEMLILQTADRTNPQAEPIQAPSLKPYTEKRMYLKDKKRKGDLEMERLIQLFAWNPGASSLQPIVKKGFTIHHPFGRRRGSSFSIMLGSMWCSLDIQETSILLDSKFLKPGRAGTGGRSQGMSKRFTRFSEKVFLR